MLRPTRIRENVMKPLKSCIMLIAILCANAFMVSCDETEVKGSVDFGGKVKVSPSVAKVGDEVIFSLDNSFSVGGITTDYSSSTIIDEKEIVKSVVYYIDGNEIGEASNKDSDYTVEYRVTGLTVGVHVVSAHCNSNFKDVEIKEAITSGTLIIEE